MKRDKLHSWLNNYLRIDNIKDYCPNGLQIEGRDEIKHIITAVSASEELIIATIEANADTILVHHGLIWKGNWNTITGPYYRKVKQCLDNQINLLAYHLPLDAHIEIGNAAEIARLFTLTALSKFAIHDGLNYGVSGKFNGTKEEFISIVNKINSNALCLLEGKHIKNVAIVTGAGQDEFQGAIKEGFDTFLTGEASEWVFHLAKENEVNYIALGHHVSERYGIRSLGRKIRTKFSLKITNIDLHNPI